MKKLFLLLMTVILAGACAMAQTRTVTGTVVYDGDDEPLAGATVMPIGGGHGASTDIDGHFTLQVPQNCRQLRVSYVGMITQTVDIKGGNLLVKLSSTDTQLDEVMVVAYGTAKKSAYTGSATVVKADQIEKAQVSNPLDALTGRVAGVQIMNSTGQPGQTSPTIRIRGISSVNAGNAPLVVVDGMPFDGDLNTLNSNDIESMSVLKDAASNALYGARGANGVIMITTKHGRINEGAKVTLDVKLGSNSRALQTYKTINDPGKYYETYYQALNSYALANGMSADAAWRWAAGNMVSTNSSTIGTLGYNAYTLPYGQYLIGKDGKLNPSATLGNKVTYNGQEYYIQPDNWLDEAYNNSLRQEYNVSITNATEKSNFYLSAGYLDNEGIVTNSNFKRFTGRLSADIQAKSWLKVGATATYTHYNAQTVSGDGDAGSTGNIFSAATSIAPIYPVYIRDGNGNIMYDSYGNIRRDYGDGANAGLVRPQLNGGNPLDSQELDENSSSGNSFMARGFAEIVFLKDFKFTTNNTVFVDETRFTDYTNPYYGSYIASNGMISIEHDRNTSYSYQQLLTYAHRFGLHDVNVMVGHETYWYRSAYVGGTRHNMFSPDIKELYDAIISDNSYSASSSYNTEGWFARAQYDYDQRYFASVSYRRDGSSRFHPKHRWGNFYSVGAAWLINKEAWFNASWVDMLKIKASYGEQGNDQIGSYRYTNTYAIANSDGVISVTPSSRGNENITWEKGGNFNAGVDFEFFNGRLGGTAEGFYRKTSNMLFYFPMAPSMGYTGYYANVGDMTNSGFELDLHGDIIANRHLTWSVNANIAFEKNRLSYLPDERKTATVDGVSGYSSGNYFYGEGIPMYTWYMKQYAGVNENGQGLYYKNVTAEDGTVTKETTTDYSAADDYLCGSARPTAFGGFGTSLKYAGFDLDIQFAYQIGGKVYDSTYASYMAAPYSTRNRGIVLHEDILKSWRAENSGSNIPRFMYGEQYNESTSDRFLTNASYLSLQNINFGYTLPTKVTRRLYLDKVRFYVSCENVALWSKRRGLDPRQFVSGSSSSEYYSPIRTISGGLNVSF
jgi:TonB-linked SusC/RagA family outer membrane protein